MCPHTPESTNPSNTQNRGPGQKELPARPLAGSRARMPYLENRSVTRAKHLQFLKITNQQIWEHSSV